MLPSTLVLLLTLQVSSTDEPFLQQLAADEGRPLWVWSCERLQGSGFLSVAGGAFRWTSSQGEEPQGVRSEVLGRVRAGERVVLRSGGPARSRVVQEPRSANDLETIAEVPAPLVGWNPSGDTRSSEALDGPYSLELLAVPGRDYEAARPFAAEQARDVRAAFRAERGGHLREALELWEEIFVGAADPRSRALALERYADLHRDVEFELTEADEVKLEALRREHTREFYGGEGTVLVGRYVQLLWDEPFAAHPSVPRFLAELDAGYAAMIRLTGQDPTELFGNRLSFFFVPGGGAFWFDHHIGMSEDHLVHPPYRSVYWHEMGHDFFKFTGVTPESAWGEGIATVAQLAALDSLGYRDALHSIWKEGLRLVEEHAEQGASIHGAGLYLLGASIFLLQAAEVDETARRVQFDWEAVRRVFTRFREQALEPRSPRDRYRHFAAGLADELGPEVLTDLERLGFPVDAEDAALVRVEERKVLQPILDARQLLAEGRAAAAMKAIRRPSSGPRTRLRGEVTMLLLECMIAGRDTREAERLAPQLGLLREWCVGPALDPEVESGAHGFGGEQRVERAEGERSVLEVHTALPGFDSLDLPGFREHRETRLDGRVDLNAVLGLDGTRPAKTMVVCLLESEHDQVVDLRFGHDDGIEVFLNGRSVHRVDVATTVHADASWTPLSLSQGTHTLALVVENRGGEYGFLARVTGPDGLKAPGVSARLPALRTDVPHEPRQVWSIGVEDGDFAEFGGASHPEGYGKSRERHLQFDAGIDPALAWSAIHPGPRDTWAGSTTHDFEIRFALDEVGSARYELTIDTVSQNGWTPPTLEVALGEARRRIELPGGPDEALRDARQGQRCRIRLAIPSALLSTGNNVLTLSVPEGSWILYDALTLTAR